MSTSGQAPSSEEMAELLPAIAKSLEGASRNAKVSPVDMQATFWNQAVHDR